MRSIKNLPHLCVESMSDKTPAGRKLLDVLAKKGPKDLKDARKFLLGIGIPLAVGATVSNVADYSALRETERKAIGKTNTNFPKYMGRRIGSGVAGVLVPIPGFNLLAAGATDYAISRKLYNNK